MKKRGKDKGFCKTEKTNNKVHSKLALDNILTKVQVNFITFLVAVSNEIIKDINVNDNNLVLFNDIEYKNKKYINYKHFEELKDKQIKDILFQNVSKKNKSIKENHNKEIYNKIKNKSQYIEIYFNMNYLEIFKQYFNSEDKI